MSQGASRQSSLHPVLQAALASLDVTLESELERYRAHQKGAPLAVTTAQEQPHLLAAMPSSEIATHKLTATVPLAAATDSAAALTTSLDRFFELNDSPTAATNSTSHFSPEASSLATFKLNNHFTSSSDAFNLSTPAESSRFLVPTTNSPAMPNSFLASSEALLQNLAPAQTQTSHWSQKWLTPWGIAAAITVSVGLLVAGFNFYQTRAKRPAMADAATPAGSVAQSPQPRVAPVPAKTATVPDLSRKEFVDLNLANLSRISPTASKAQLQPTAQKVSPAVTPPVKPGQLHSATRLTVSAPNVEATSYFYVVTPYFSEAELQRIQTLIPEAFLANFPDGTQVQVGSFDNSRDAQELVRFLKSQGISVTVRRAAGRD